MLIEANHTQNSERFFMHNVNTHQVYILVFLIPKSLTKSYLLSYHQLRNYSNPSLKVYHSIFVG